VVQYVVFKKEFVTGAGGPIANLVLDQRHVSPLGSMEVRVPTEGEFHGTMAAMVRTIEELRARIEALETLPARIGALERELRQLKSAR
jgi:hypothetical protein